MTKQILYLIIILVPLAFVPHIRSNPFDLVKFLMLMVFTIMLTVSTIRSKRSFKSHPFLFSILLFLIVSILASIFSIDPVTSTIGKYRRYDGLLTLMCHVFIFFVFINYITRKDVERMVFVIIWVATVAACYGIVQHFGLDIVLWSSDFGNGGRCFSTFGHPAFFSAFLIMVIPLVLYRYFLTAKYVYLIPLVLILCTLYWTKTRAAFLGLIISCSFYFLMSRDYLLWRRKIRFLIIGLIFISMPIYFGITDKQSVVSRLNKEVSIKGETHGTASERLLFYRVAWGVIKDYPVMGIGQDCFSQVYFKYLAREILGVETKLKNIDTLAYVGFDGIKRYYKRSDRVHNDILAILVSRGFLGLASYLFFVAMFIRMVWRRCANGNLLVIALVSGLIAYFVQNQFSFGVISINVLYWYLLGMVFVMCERE